jgi:hypothetical protein
VLDKVATFGILRYSLPLFPDAARWFAPVALTLAVVGIIYAALLAVGQNDLKRLVAYTSIAHFGFIGVGIFVFTLQGGTGAVLYMVNHGLATAGLFLLAGYMYRRTGTMSIRDLLEANRDLDEKLQREALRVTLPLFFPPGNRPFGWQDPRQWEAFAAWMRGARSFGKKFWEELGERRSPRIVFEHTGADTLPTSLYLCDNSGMVVICGATSGFQADVDLRFLWMRLKRLQGSHFASPAQCRMVIDLVEGGQLDPCVTKTVPFDEIGEAHQLLRDNKQPPGNMAALVNAAPGQFGLDP